VLHPRIRVDLDPAAVIRVVRQIVISPWTAVVVAEVTVVMVTAAAAAAMTRVEL